MTDRSGLPLLWWLAALLALLAVPAFVRHDGVLFFTTYVLIWAIFALGYDLAFGLSGLLSMGHAAFFGIGGYSIAILTMRHGVAFEPALLLAALMAALAASLFGIVALRLSGIFFVLIFTAQASALLWRRPPPGLIGRNLLSSLLGAAIAVAALWAIERFIPAFAT